jgi:hypothetical protein
MKEPIAYLMIERNTGERYVQTNTPTREEKISHEPYEIYHLEDRVSTHENQQEWLRTVRKTGY